MSVCVLVCAHADMCYCSADHSMNLLKWRKIWEFYDLSGHGGFFQFGDFVSICSRSCELHESGRIAVKQLQEFLVLLPGQS